MGYWGCGGDGRSLTKLLREIFAGSGTAVPPTSSPIQKDTAVTPPNFFVRFFAPSRTAVPR
ncbi:MAG: hypothetical protein H6662_17430 [Ardenticatenaceae bacterium]|nr:hypothetical protein [Ardenticatenaceae bacterium]